VRTLNKETIEREIEYFADRLIWLGVKEAVAEGECSKSDLLTILSEKLGEVPGPSLWGLNPGDEVRIAGRCCPYIESDILHNRVKVMSPDGVVVISLKEIGWRRGLVFHILAPKSKYRVLELNVRAENKGKGKKLKRKTFTRTVITAESVAEA